MIDCGDTQEQKKGLIYCVDKIKGIQNSITKCVCARVCASVREREHWNVSVCVCVCVLMRACACACACTRARTCARVCEVEHH